MSMEIAMTRCPKTGRNVRTARLLLGCIAAVWCLSQVEVAADENYPPVPEEIPEDLAAAMDTIEKSLGAKDGVSGVESVLVITLDGQFFAFANEKVRASTVTFEISDALLAVPKHNGTEVIWTTDYDKIKVHFNASPGTTLECDEKQGGKRPCRQSGS